MFTNEILHKAHQMSVEPFRLPASNRGQQCGCYHCQRIFSGLEFESEEVDGSHSVQCPFCCMDSVIIADFGFPVTAEFLSALNKRFFPEIPRDKVDPSGFVSCFQALTRHDQRGVINAVGRHGCQLCKKRKEWPLAIDEMTQDEFVCEHEVDIRFFTECLNRGIELAD